MVRFCRLGPAGPRRRTGVSGGDARMRIIVGLGNPGRKYDWTPHNLGFQAVDLLAERWNIRVTRPEAQSLIGLGRIAGEEAVVAKPQTYMNSSGHAVADLLERHEADASELIVVSDEIALPWSMIRIRERGSAGGHNGLKSVIGALGTDEFLRVRLGIRPKFPVLDLATYDLSPMGKDVRKVAEEMIAGAADAVEMILADGVSRAMAKFNRKVEPEEAAAESS
ncbi:MAG TPA: aminoacyl-tRNA hydrolase [Candidatus Acidoferrales bacterium]|nr:aminoacyl-tRNA hydrolase [Candidatus Acidoferrales bacterium]